MTTIENQVVNKPTKPLPTPAELAGVAAALIGARIADRNSAAIEAFRLWTECQEYLDSKAELHARIEAEKATWVKCDNWPIDFDKALKLIMPNVKAPARSRRFKEYLRAKDCTGYKGKRAERQLQKTLQDFKERLWGERITNHMNWAFNEWWDAQLSVKRSLARKTNLKKPLESV